MKISKRSTLSCRCNKDKLECQEKKVWIMNQRTFQESKDHSMTFQNLLTKSRWSSILFTWLWWQFEKVNRVVASFQKIHWMWKNSSHSYANQCGMMCASVLIKTWRSFRITLSKISTSLKTRPSSRTFIPITYKFSKTSCRLLSWRQSQTQPSTSRIWCKPASHISQSESFTSLNSSRMKESLRRKSWLSG